MQVIHRKGVQITKDNYEIGFYSVIANKKKY